MANLFIQRDKQLDAFKANVKVLMKREKLNQAQLGRCFGHGQSWFSKKLSTGDFDVNELILLFFFLKADADEISKMFLMRRTNE